MEKQEGCIAAIELIASPVSEGERGGSSGVGSSIVGEGIVGGIKRMGITTWIRSVMRGGVEFRVSKGGKPNAYKGHQRKGKACKGGNQMGLVCGRYYDVLFQRVIQKKASLSSMDKRHEVLGHVFSALRKNGIVVTRVQVPVKRRYSDGCVLATQLDGLGYMVKRGKPTVVVFELKTTRDTEKEHKGRYMSECMNQRVMKNGLPNTEYSAHSLQTGFGVACVKERLNSAGMGDVRVVGVVCVACVDVACVYYTPEVYYNVEMYSGSRGVPLTGEKVCRGSCKGTTRRTAHEVTSRVHPYSSQSKGRFLKWPSNYAGSPELYEAIYQRGYIEVVGEELSIEYGVRGCSGVGIAPVGKKGAEGAVESLCVIGLLGPRCKASTENDKRIVAREAKKLYKRRKGKVTVQGFVVYSMSTTYNGKRIEVEHVITMRGQG